MLFQSMFDLECGVGTLRFLSFCHCYTYLWNKKSYCHRNISHKTLSVQWP